MNAALLHSNVQPKGDATRDWPIFVISLTDAAERRRAISAQLSALAVEFEILDAVDGRRGVPAEYEPMIDRAGTLATLGRAMTGGEYACALSHLAIYQRILDEDLPGAVVLEDDAVLGPAFRAFLHQKAYNLADLIQMDHFQARVWRFGGRHRIDPGVTLARWSQNSYLTTGYSISRKGAKYILDHALPLRRTADWPCDLLDISPLLTLPRIVDHPEAIAANSSLLAEREVVLGTPSKAVKDPRRFLQGDYWRRWIIKRLTKRVS